MKLTLKESKIAAKVSREQKEIQKNRMDMMRVLLEESIKEMSDEELNDFYIKTPQLPYVPEKIKIKMGYYNRMRAIHGPTLNDLKYYHLPKVNKKHKRLKKPIAWFA